MFIPTVPAVRALDLPSPDEVAAARMSPTTFKVTIGDFEYCGTCILTDDDRVVSVVSADDGWDRRIAHTRLTPEGAAKVRAHLAG